MTALWAQHGYGKGDKLDALQEHDRIVGVVLSPGDEDRNGLEATIASMSDVRVVLDPQTYVYSIPDGTARCHSSHGLEFPDLHWSAPPVEISAIADAVVAANAALQLETVIAPTCMQRSLSDVWTSLALQLVRATLSSADTPVWASVVVDEAALSNWRDIEAWLDTATTLDVEGFYLVVNRPTRSYPQAWEPTRLANYLRLIYSLAELNGYTVINGYSDFEGLLTLAAGADGHGSGWYYTLRQFVESKWQPSKGGRAASPRVTSSRLLTPLSVSGEAELIVGSSRARQVLPSSEVRQRLGDDPDSWSLADSWSQHLMVLARMSSAIGEHAELSDRADELTRRIDRGRKELAQLSQEGVVLPGTYDTRLRVYGEALSEFRESEDI